MRPFLGLVGLVCACGVPCEDQVDYRNVIEVPIVVHGMTSEDLDRGVDLVMGAQLGAMSLFGVMFQFEGVALDAYVRNLDAFHEPSSTFLGVTDPTVVDVFLVDQIETNDHEYAAVTYSDGCSTAIVAAKNLSSGGFLHEIGHAFSLDHVSYQDNVMNVSFSARDLPNANILPLQYERARTCLACLVPCWKD